MVKKYKERIQHSAGVPEPTYEQTKIRSESECYHGLHNFSKTEVSNCTFYQADSGFSLYRVVVFHSGRVVYGQQLSNGAMYTVKQKPEHVQLMQHFNLTK